MQNNPGLLFLTEGPPLDQIIGRAVDTSLPSIVSAEGRRTISHTHPDVFQSARPSFLLMYICCRGATVQLSLLSCVSGNLRNGNDVKTIGKNVKDVLNPVFLLRSHVYCTYIVHRLLLRMNRI